MNLRSTECTFKGIQAILKSCCSYSLKLMNLEVVCMVKADNAEDLTYIKYGYKLYDSVSRNYSYIHITE